MLKSWGISTADAQGIAATLMDWTDADDLKRRPDSAEKLDYDHLGYSDRPFNRKFSSLNEVDLVARADEIQAARPDWRSFFTLRGTGPLTAGNSPLVFDTATVSTDKFLRISVPKSAAATDVTFTVEATSDLSNSANWSSAGLVTEQDTSTRLIVRDSQPISSGGPRFMRVKVVRQ
ncbi:MAG: hypothetical protein B7Z47_07440 [Chthoniobacter sp. 12-60-6]|nr:MAG: hypothetical protein B7Z47_07440 [Chthoniobacter sp. 12-60-6]